MENKEKRGEELLASWNKFAGLLIEAGKVWKEHTKLVAKVPKEEIEELCVELQKFVSKNFNKSKFDIMLPRLVDYWRALGGIETLFVRLEGSRVEGEEMLRKIKKKREEVKNARSN